MSGELHRHRSSGIHIDKFDLIGRAGGGGIGHIDLHDAILVLIADGDGHGVGQAGVKDAISGLAGMVFHHGVGVSAQSIELQSGEGEAAGGIVPNILDGLAPGILQQEAELTGLQRTGEGIVHIQLLSAVDDDLAIVGNNGLIGVIKHDLVCIHTVLGAGYRADLQFTAAVVGDHDGSHINCGILGHTGLLMVQLSDLILINAGLGEGDGAKVDAAACCCVNTAGCRHGCAGGDGLQQEAEGVAFHIQTGVGCAGGQIGEGLFCGDILGDGFGLVGICEGNGLGTQNIAGSQHGCGDILGLAAILLHGDLPDRQGIAVAAHRHGNAVLGIVHGNAVAGEGGLLDHIVEGGIGGDILEIVGDGGEDDIAGCAVLLGIHEGQAACAFGIQSKLELAILQAHQLIGVEVGQSLEGLNGQLGGVGCVSIVKIGGHLPSTGIGGDGCVLDAVDCGDHQLACAIVRHHDLKVMAGAVIGPTGSDIFGNDLFHTEVVAAGGIQGQTCQAQRTGSGAAGNGRVGEGQRGLHGIAADGNGSPHPGSRVILHQTEGEGIAALQLGVIVHLDGDILGHIHGDAAHSDADGGIGIQQGCGRSGIGCDGTFKAVAFCGIAGRHIAGGQLLHQVGGVSRNTCDIHGVAVFDGKGDLVLGVYRNGSSAHIDSLAGHAGQRDADLELGQSGRCSSTLIVGHGLGDQEAAVFLDVVGENDLMELVSGNGAACHRAVYHRTGSGNEVQLVAADGFLRHGVGCAHIHAGDGDGLVSTKLQSQLAIVKGRFCAVYLHLAVGVTGDGDGKGEALAAIGNALYQFFGENEALGRRIGDPAVVAHVDKLISMGIVAIERSIHQLMADGREAAGDIFGLFQVVRVGSTAQSAGRDVPAIVACFFGHAQCIFGQFLIVHSHGCILLITGLVGIGGGVDHMAVVKLAAGTVGTGVDCAVGIRIHHRIGGEVVMLVGLAGLEIGVGNGVQTGILQNIAQLIILTGRIVQVCLTGGGSPVPCVGVEVVVAVGILGPVAGTQEIDDIFGGHRAMHAHLVNQVDGGSGIVCDGGTVCDDVAITVQLHMDLIGNRGQQRGRHTEGDGLGAILQHLAIGDGLGDLHHDVHHVRCVGGLTGGGGAQHTVAEVCIGCALGNDGIGIHVVPEAHIIAVGIGKPADVVAESTGFGIVGDLAGGISLPCQGPNGFGIGDAQPLLQRPDHVIAQGGGSIGSAESTLDHGLGQLCTGVQSIAGNDALDILDFHAGADLIYEGDIAIGIQIGAGDTGNIVAGAEADLVDDLLKGSRQLAGILGGEVLVGISHLILAADGSIVSNRHIGGAIGVIAAVMHRDGHGLFVGVGKGSILIPQSCHICMGLGGIQHRLCHGNGVAVGGKAQAHGIHIGIGLIGVGAIFLRHLGLDIGSGQLGQEALALFAAIAVAAFILGRNIIKVIGDEGRCAVTHQYQHGCPFADCGCGVELLPGSPQTALDVSTATGGKGGLHLGALAIGDVGIGSRGLIAAHAARAVVGTVVAAAAAAGGGCHTACTDGAACVLDVLNDTVAGRILVGNGSIAIQRQQNRCLGGVNHHAHPAFFVGGEQSMNGIVGSGDHGAQVGVAHTAGDIQHEHGIRRRSAGAGNHTIGRQSRQYHQKVVLVHLNAQAVQGTALGKGCGLGQDRLVRPNAAGVFCGQIGGVKGSLLPGIHGRRVGNGLGRQNSLRNIGRSRLKAQGRKNGKHHHSTQHQGNESGGYTVLSSHHSGISFCVRPKKWDSFYEYRISQNNTKMQEKYSYILPFILAAKQNFSVTMLHAPAHGQMPLLAVIWKCWTNRKNLCIMVLSAACREKEKRRTPL